MSLSLRLSLSIWLLKQRMLNAANEDVVNNSHAVGRDIGR